MPNRSNKGQIRIIEAFLAVSVIFSALALTAPLSSKSQNMEAQAKLKQMGAQVLIELDSNGTLSRLIEVRNWTALKQSLSVSLPSGVIYNLTVYDENMQRINTEEVANSSQLGSEAVVVQHLCATQSASVYFYNVRLQLAWPG